MLNTFKEKAIGMRAFDDSISRARSPADYIKQAVEADNAGELQKAFDLYKIALEYFSTHLKYEKNPRARDAITAKVVAVTCITTTRDHTAATV